MYNVEYTNRFKRDYKIALKRGYKESLIQSVIATIATKKALAPKHNAHKLSGAFKDCWECHIYQIGCLSGVRMKKQTR